MGTEGIVGQRDSGTKGQWDKGTVGQRDICIFDFQIRTETIYYNYYIYY